MNKYDKQAADFCKRNGVKITTKYIGDVKGFPNDPNDMMMHEEWCVRIFHEKTPEEFMQFPFYGSYHDWNEHHYLGNPRKLSKYNVLACISAEQYCPDDIEDFMAEFGYEIIKKGDFTRIKNIFEGCKKMADDLHRIFSEEELEELSEIV